MDNSSFVVRHSNTGQAADDLVVGIEEGREQLAINTLADARIAASANAATFVSQYAAGLTTVTSTQLSDKANAINTTGKVKGKPCYCSTTDLMYYAIGTADTGKWRLFGAVDSTGDVTPS